MEFSLRRICKVKTNYHINVYLIKYRLGKLVYIPDEFFVTTFEYIFHNPTLSWRCSSILSWGPGLIFGVSQPRRAKYLVMTGEDFVFVLGAFLVIAIWAGGAMGVMQLHTDLINRWF